MHLNRSPSNCAFSNDPISPISLHGLVLTSINPNSRIDYQVDCIKAWRSLGLRVIVCQSKTEAPLLELRLEGVAEVFEISEAASGKHLHGKPVPRLMPMFDLVLNHFRPQFLILTNSDIYPCLRKVPSALFCRRSAYAFARKEVLTLNKALRGNTIYRGGLDVFSFTLDALADTWRILENDPIAERMSFGIPGWDYFLAASILQSRIGGLLLDGPFFLHQSHRTTYGNVNEFGHYIPKLKQYGLVKSDNPAIAAAEFAAKISLECDSNSKQSGLLQLMYDAFSVRHDREGLTDVPQAVFKLCADDPSLLRFSSVIADIYHHLSSSEMCLEGLQSFVFESESVVIRFEEYLALMYLIVKIRSLSHPPAPITRYPKGNSHRAAIANVSAISDKFQRRFHHLDIFCHEFIYHGIFNRNDLKAIALSCVNDRERSLVRNILNTIKHDIHPETTASH